MTTNRCTIRAILSCVVWIHFLIRTNLGNAYDDFDPSSQRKNWSEFLLFKFNLQHLNNMKFMINRWLYMLIYKNSRGKNQHYLYKMVLRRKTINRKFVSLKSYVFWWFSPLDLRFYFCRSFKNQGTWEKTGTCQIYSIDREEGKWFSLCSSPQSWKITFWLTIRVCLCYNKRIY